MGNLVSVVIPALEEEASIGAAIRSVSAQAEVIVVDGGSRDRTCAVALAAGARVLSASACRGSQLACGAVEAGGEWLVFLHADTRLEPGWAAALARLPAGVAGGAFRFAIDSPRRVYRWLERGVSLRCRLLSLPYGDQAIFARREAYAACGGYPPLPLMEDVAFVTRLARVGPLAFLEERAFTSPRRYERRGVFTNMLRNWWLLGLYAAGVSPALLSRRYEATRPSL